LQNALIIKKLMEGEKMRISHVVQQAYSVGTTTRLDNVVLTPEPASAAVWLVLAGLVCARR
jgi:hypothetical protein